MRRSCHLRTKTSVPTELYTLELARPGQINSVLKSGKETEFTVGCRYQALAAPLRAAAMQEKNPWRCIRLIARDVRPFLRLSVILFFERSPSYPPALAPDIFCHADSGRCCPRSRRSPIHRPALFPRFVPIKRPPRAFLARLAVHGRGTLYLGYNATYRDRGRRT